MAAAIIALYAACERTDRDLATADTAFTDARGRIGALTDTVAGRISGREYTTAELAGFLNAYNDAEIEIGELARTKATDPQVRQFAQRIVQDHGALKKEVTSTGQRLNLTLTMPEDDEDLREDHQDGLRDLRDRPRGPEFDEAFLDHEIKMHKKVLDEVEDVLDRNQNMEIRPLLERARTSIQAHLTTAEELAKKFD